MYKRIKLGLAIVLVLSLAGGAWMSASAEGPEVPFKAYYPVIGVVTFDPSCGCMRQVFTPRGNGLASHLGVSQLYGTGQFWVGNPIITNGNATLIAANGDSLSFDYEGTGVVQDQRLVVDGTYVITGGTGRFLNVTGEGAYHVVVYTSSNEPDFWMEGHLHNP